MESRRPLPLAGEPDIVEYQGNIEADLKVVSRNGLAERITGGLSRPSKMPCPAWGVSAFRCRLGSLLAEREGTVCSACYARKGRFVFDSVQAKLEQRYRGLFNVLWTPSMVFLIRWQADRYFRFFDSGDLQSLAHLRNICTVTRHVPDVRFWLPTREADIVRDCADDIPANLCIRLSATKIDGPPPTWWPTTSTVATQAMEGDTQCPASKNGGSCGNCRACWDHTIPNVCYKPH